MIYLLREALKSNSYRYEKSYRAFHHPNVDYINMGIFHDYMLKVYFIKPTPGLLVEPHSHAYPFEQHVLDGSVTNITYGEGSKIGLPISGYNKFDYESPLNNGSGFTLVQENIDFECTSIASYGRDGKYSLCIYDIHTIRVEVTTILFTIQFNDQVKKTQFYSLSKEPPSIQGLYQPWTIEKFHRKLDRLEELLKRI